jgi:hypothetical protein
MLGGPYPGSAIPTSPLAGMSTCLPSKPSFYIPLPPNRSRASSSRFEWIQGAWKLGGPSWGVQRASPYPASPSSSPARLTEPLPDPGLGNGQAPLINSISRGDVYQSDYASGGSRGATPSAIVARPNVTTTATADASMKRRINDAKFVCPVPGCGSTFTRHFNLKGM